MPFAAAAEACQVGAIHDAREYEDQYPKVPAEDKPAARGSAQPVRGRAQAHFPSTSWR